MKTPKQIVIIIFSLYISACQTTGEISAPKSKYQLNESLEKAKVAYHDGRLVEAETLYLKILSAQPEVSDAWFKLGNIYYRTGRYSASVNAYESVLRVDNKNERAWYNLALARLSQSIEVIDMGMSVIDASSEFYKRSAKLRKSLVTRVGESLGKQQ